MAVVAAICAGAAAIGALLVLGFYLRRRNVAAATTPTEVEAAASASPVEAIRISDGEVECVPPSTVMPPATQQHAARPQRPKPARKYVTPPWLRPPSLSRLEHRREPEAQSSAAASSKYLCEPLSGCVLPGPNGGGGTRLAPPVLLPPLGWEPPGGSVGKAVLAVADGATMMAESIRGRSQSALRYAR